MNGYCDHDRMPPQRHMLSNFQFELLQISNFNFNFNLANYFVFRLFFIFFFSFLHFLLFIHLVSMVRGEMVFSMEQHGERETVMERKGRHG